MSSPLRATLRDRLKEAMRARDRASADALRSVIAALENAEAVPVPTPGATARAAPATSEHVAGTAVGLGAAEAQRRELTPEDERVIVEGEIAELRACAATMAAAGHEDRSRGLLRSAQTVEDILRS